MHAHMNSQCRLYGPAAPTCVGAHSLQGLQTSEKNL